MTAPPTPPTRTRRGVLAAAVLIVLFVIGNGAVQLTAQILHTHLREDSTIVPVAQRLTVIGNNGYVILNPSRDSNVHVTVSGEYGGRRPDLIHTSTDAGVRLEARCSDGMLVDCRIEYDIQVPPGFDVQVQGAPTDVLVTKLTGPVAIAVETGGVSLNSLSGPVNVNTGDGRISGQLWSTAVAVNSSAGDVSLDLMVAPESLAVRTGFGNVRIRVPGEFSYRVSADTEMGARTVAVTQDATAGRSITATTESGDLRILPWGRGFGPAPIEPVLPPLVTPKPIAPVRPEPPG